MRGKERTKERVRAGRCHGGRGCEVNVEREGETLQMGALPLCPGKHLVEGQAEAAQDNTTGLLCPLLCDLCERVHSAPLNPRALCQAPQSMPGCARWVGDIYQADTSIPGWKQTEILLGHFESTGQKHLDGLLILTEI